MNDFTKEELDTILDVFHYAKQSPCWTKYHEEPELRNKIKSMIENYSNEKTCQVKFNLGLSAKQINYLVDECIMPFLYPEKKK